VVVALASWHGWVLACQTSLVLIRMAVSARAESGSSLWRAGGIALFGVSAFLLLSMGGAIVAAPVTVPLLFVVVRHHPTTAFRVTGALLAAATSAEVVWALTYLAVEDATPWIWLLPLVGAAATSWALLRSTSGWRSSSAPV